MLIHPLVVHFPIALWLTAAFFDVLHLRRPDRALFGESAYWLTGIGLAAAFVAIAMGWLDLLNLEAQGVGTGLEQRHLRHSVVAYCTTALFLGLFVWRWRTRNRMPAWAIVLSVAGALAVALTGYLGHDMRSVM
ncbi:MAG TPA: DUF2231 domain-containing protein [Gaiellales bacterium]|nr:DUF2231 domain-containing protein [Gaiellales bacterium]